MKANRPNINPQTFKNKNHQKQTQEKNLIIDDIREAIAKLNKQGFNAYPIRDLVKHSEEFGSYLSSQKLKTNQVRKFLDAVNRIKANLTEKEDFKEIEAEVVLLKPKLAYAAARQSAAKSLSKVMSAAIDKVHSLEDFERLVQFIESIIAYHKAAGGE